MKRIAALMLLGWWVALQGDALAQAAPAQDASNDDDRTLLERLLVTPREDEYSKSDARRHAIERSLPGADAPLPETGFDNFLDTLLKADINQAGTEQRVIIEKLHDPDINRLPRN